MQALLAGREGCAAISRDAERQLRRAAEIDTVGVGRIDVDGNVIEALRTTEAVIDSLYPGFTTVARSKNCAAGKARGRIDIYLVADFVDGELRSGRCRSCAGDVQG